MTYFYFAFGLLIESDIACPELMPGDRHGAPDVRIALEDVPDLPAQPRADGTRWRGTSGCFQEDIDGIARFLVRDGDRIAIEPAPGAADEIIRGYLLSAGMAILLHQRHLFVLHCSGVVTRQGAILFAGRSGTGKSTMAGAFLKRGWKIIADDMLALTFNENGRVIALPGFPVLKLWGDTAAALGRSTAELRRVTPDSDKFVASEINNFSAEPANVHALYDLRTGHAQGLSLEPLAHTARFHILLEHTWQKRTLGPLGVREWHFKTAARIASAVYEARLSRPNQTLMIDEAAELIEADINREHALA